MIAHALRSNVISMIRLWTAAIVACTIVGQINADQQARDKLFLAPSQNMTTLKKAWKTKVSVGYKVKSFEEILKDLSRQLGIEIRLETEKLTKKESLKGHRFSSVGPMYQENSYHAVVATHFIGAEDSEKTRATQYYIDCNCDTPLVQFKCSTSVPVAAAIGTLAQTLELEVSYRKDCIVIGDYARLASEVLTTREFKVQKGVGTVYCRFNVLKANSTEYNLSLLDKVSLALASSRGSWRRPDAKAIEQNPTNAFEQLRRIDPRVVVKFSDSEKLLTISADPETLFEYVQYDLAYVDKSARHTKGTIAKIETGSEGKIAVWIKEMPIEKPDPVKFIVTKEAQIIQTIIRRNGYSSQSMEMGNLKVGQFVMLSAVTQALAPESEPAVATCIYVNDYEDSK